MFSFDIVLASNKGWSKSYLKAFSWYSGLSKSVKSLPNERSLDSVNFMERQIH